MIINQLLDVQKKEVNNYARAGKSTLSLHRIAVKMLNPPMFHSLNSEDGTKNSSYDSE